MQRGFVKAQQLWWEVTYPTRNPGRVAAHVVCHPLGPQGALGECQRMWKGRGAVGGHAVGHAHAARRMGRGRTGERDGARVVEAATARGERSAAFRFEARAGGWSQDGNGAEKKLP